MTSVEFRDRSKRAPGGELRIFLGRGEGKALARLEEQRALLQRLATRGEYDVLVALKNRELTVDQLGRLIDHHGIRDYRAHLVVRPIMLAPTLAEHVERFLPTVENPRTRTTYERGLQSLLAYRPEDDGRLGDRPWPDVHPHHVRDLKPELLSTLAPATVANYMAAWSAFFDWALLREESEAAEAERKPLAVTNPVRRARAWVRVQPTRQRFLTHAEYEELLRVSEPMMRAQYATLTLCGLRNGEFRHLPPAHVRPESHIHVGPWGDWSPKGWPRSRRAVRDVPVHQTRLRPLLEEYRERWAGDGTFFVNPRTGEAWGEKALREQFYRDAEKAGLTTRSREGGEATPEGVVPHTLRHTFASWLAMKDVQLLKIARLMGDTETTVRTYYAHHLPSTLDESVHRLFSDGKTDPVSNVVTTAPEKAQ